MKLNDCYFDKKDWRSCKKEVRYCPYGFATADPLFPRFKSRPSGVTTVPPADAACLLDGRLPCVLEEAGERPENGNQGGVNYSR